MLFDSFDQVRVLTKCSSASLTARNTCAHCGSLATTWHTERPNPTTNNVRRYCNSCGRTYTLTVTSAGRYTRPHRRPQFATFLDSHNRRRIQLGVGHPFANTGGWQIYARYSVMCELGRTLSRDEEVHHVDDNKTNDDGRNLVVVNVDHHRRCRGVYKRYGERLKADDHVSDNFANDAHYCDQSREWVSNNNGAQCRTCGTMCAA